MSLTKRLQTLTAAPVLLLSLIWLGALTPLPAAAKVLATVNGKQITDEDLTLAEEDLRANLPPQLEGKEREGYLLDYLINSEIVAQKAIADKGDQTPEFAKKLAYYREKL
ncbi:MAG: peptidylprolyl isomerase, partial [Alphaproteobacteria bacterium]|nr:peptidylprolyl isomerase [Alphaproteobacteria bacterium]